MTETPVYPEKLTIEPLVRSPDTTITVPGSKSITNRALIMAALAEGRSVLLNALESEDTEVMAESLRRLGVGVHAEGNRFVVEGTGGQIAPGPKELFVANSGTSMRFLTALCALGVGRYRLDGVERMRQRPQGDLLAALQQMGINAYSERGNDSPPLIVEANGVLAGGRVKMNAEASSQFLTALLIVAPYALKDITVDVTGALRPFYVELTCRMAAQWGVTIDAEPDKQRFYVRHGQRYKPQQAYYVEPDASGASYFFAAAALTGGQVCVAGLKSDALQGDVRFATEVLAAMGCAVEERAEGLCVQGPPPGLLRGVVRDMSAISDTALTLAAIAPFANSPTTVSNIAHSRYQECDRIHAVCTELSKLGVRVEEHFDGYTIWPAEKILPGEIETYRDHRVAMSFALIGLRVPGIVIRDPACVAKTFPNYWQCLEQLYT
ncbi:3-phosphoshikimate 1-carboxyvinyltransferase [Chthonomonas calidirosea]|uniref:3-phosphoshikimate 1-carboxyvinyltransferase n=1 Tax=Chthonomonas calidirosea TaxID=454171 RepID=UPI0006ECA28D|nr:3-phosphoshikimate 1-carboxyvinyltransferase [Chthonomonas calidirosea]CEK20090.1 3-phosphoshikimate 1-carboxyvinyltransferase [Chthonomonas calidirosea]